MSVRDFEGNRVVLPRVGREEFWEIIHEHYSRTDPHRWKGLAILALRENAGWPLEAIGAVFGHHKGHISRLLTKVKTEMRETFERSPEWLCLEEELPSEPHGKSDQARWEP